MKILIQQNVICINGCTFDIRFRVMFATITTCLLSNCRVSLNWLDWSNLHYFPWVSKVLKICVFVSRVVKLAKLKKQTAERNWTRKSMESVSQKYRRSNNCHLYLVGTQYSWKRKKKSRTNKTFSENKLLKEQENIERAELVGVVRIGWDGGTVGGWKLIIFLDSMGGTAKLTRAED